VLCVSIQDYASTTFIRRQDLSIEDAVEVLDKIRSNIQRVFTTTKDRQQRKFEKLLREKRASVSHTKTPYVNKAKWVINLSSRSLRDAEESLLKKGLNFAVTPTNILATDIIAKVESAVRSLDEERADTVMRAVITILQQAKTWKPNITP